MGCPPLIPFRIFVDYVTIFNSSPMRQLRQLRQQLRQLIQALCNELFVTKLISLNVTELLDLTLKHNKNQIKAIKYSIPQLHAHSQQRNTTTRCQIHSKLTIKTPEQNQVFLLLTLNIFCTLFYG